MGMDSTISIIIHIKDDELHVYTENGEMDIRKDFAKQLVKNTVKGMLSPLKGVFWFREISITSVKSTGTAGDGKQRLHIIDK